MGGTTLGIGLPSTYATSQSNPFALSGYGAQAFGSFPYGGPHQYTQPLQQILQVLQLVPQQLQHLQQLEYAQQQLLQQLHQILHVIPVQLAQLQQLVQSVPQQMQQVQPPSQAQQPFGQVPALGGFAATTPQWGISPQVFGPQPGHVM